MVALARARGLRAARHHLPRGRDARRQLPRRPRRRRGRLPGARPRRGAGQRRHADRPRHRLVRARHRGRPRRDDRPERRLRPRGHRRIRRVDPRLLPPRGLPRQPRRPHRPVRAAAPRRRDRRGRAHRQLRRDQERHRRGRRQGQPPELHRRRPGRRAAPTSAPAPSPATTTASSSTAPRSARAPSSARTPRWSRRSASATARWSPPARSSPPTCPPARSRIARGRQEVKPGLGRRMMERLRALKAAEGGPLMCGIVAILGRHEVAPLHPRGAEAARVPRLRQRRHRHAAGRPPGAPPRRRQADRALRPAGAATRSAATPASATPAGRPTARPRSATPTRTRPAASRWCTTASSRTTARSAPSSRPTARSSRPRPTPRRWSSSATASSRAGKPPVEAARATLARLDGAFALCFLFDGEDDLLVAARRGSPLAIGYGDGEIFVGSDALALAPLTNRIAYLEEGDHAVLTRARSTIFDADGQPVAPRDPPRPGRELLRREGPLQALHGQGDARAAAGDRRRAGALPERPTARAVRASRRSTSPTATGWCWSPAAPRTTPATWRSTGSSAWRGCRSRSRSPPSSATASRRSAPARSASSSASPARPPTRWRRCATCAAQGGRIVSVVNVETSTIARESDVALPILAGPEIGVASTKAFTCQLTVLATLAIAAGAAARPARRRRRGAAGRGARHRARPARPGAGARARDRRDRPRPLPRPRRALPRPRRRCIRWRSKAR